MSAYRFVVRYVDAVVGPKRMRLHYRLMIAGWVTVKGRCTGFVFGLN